MILISHEVLELLISVQFGDLKIFIIRERIYIFMLLLAIIINSLLSEFSSPMHAV